MLFVHTQRIIMKQEERRLRDNREDDSDSEDEEDGIEIETEDQ